MSERKSEIEFALSMIENICIEFDIALLPKQKGDVLVVAIHDNKENIDYVITEKK